jgi:hypothetical protein
MFRLLSLLTSFLCWSVAVGFAPSSSMMRSSSSSLRMSDQAPEHQDDNVVNMAPLALKMAGVLAIKTAKDVVNYPPMMLDRTLRDAQHTELPKTSPVVMVAKFLGVLVFKMAHDALYYPTIWTQRMVECQSLEECDLE